MQFKFSDTEIKKLMKNLVILIDTREQANDHITGFFDSKKIAYKSKKLDEGDYTGIIKAMPELGITRDLYFPLGVERKNSVDELAGNLSERCDTRDDIRLERELIRAKSKGITIHLVVEQPNGLQAMREGNYRSQYNSIAFVAKFLSLADRYIKNTYFISNLDSGYYIYKIIYYSIRNFLKEGILYFEDEMPTKAD